MMESRSGTSNAVSIFLTIFIFTLTVASTAPAAVPGLDLFNNGLGVSTWTFNNNGTQKTDILHGVWVVDKDNSIASDGSSHVVTVTYPGGARTETLTPTSSCGSGGCYYEYYDGGVDQGNLTAFKGIYTYRVYEAGDPSSFSEATDDLRVAPVGMLDESTFAPKHPTPQSITAYFDNVYVNGSLYDDFSTGLSSSRWSWDPRWITADSGQAKFDVDFNPGRGSYWLNLNNSAGVNQLKATVRVINMTGDLPQARVGGTAVRDHLGDIFASVRIRGNEATYSIGPEWYDGDHYRGLYYVENAVLGPVITGNRYELSLAWDAGSKTYTFHVNGLDDSVNYSASYTLSGTILPPNAPNSGLSVGGWVTTSTTPEFDWTPVTGANHYRVRIYGLNGNTIWRGYAKNPPYKLPPSILKPSSFYKYRIEAIGDHQWFEWDNVSRSDRELTRFETLAEEAQAPYVDLASVGAHTWRNSPMGDFVNFYVKIYDAQGVPQNIESVQVQTPDGGEADLYLDTNEGPNCGLYRGNYFGGVSSGDYIITAIDKDGNSHFVADYVAAMPIDAPAEASLLPSDNDVIGSTGVAFDWDDSAGAEQYEVQIYDENLSRLTTLQCLDSETYLPPGIIDEGGYFRYRVISLGEFYEDNNSNGASAPAGSIYDSNVFFTNANPGGTAVPTIDISKFGVAIWKGPHPNGTATIYNLEFSAMVTDADGVPSNIRSVEVELPGHTIKSLKFDNRPDWGFNYFEDETYTSVTSILPGEYKFTVTDFDGHTVGPVTEVLTADDLTAAAGFDWATVTLPADNATLDTTTPMITWTPTIGAAYYRVRIQNAYGSEEVYFSGPIDASTTQLTIDPGILQANRSYSIRVYSFREPIGADVDVYSESGSMAQMYHHVTIPDTVTGVDIVVAPLDQSTGESLATLTFDEVTATGTTTLVTSTTGALPPSGFALGTPPFYYEILTTATFSGSIEVCIDYGDVFFENENELELYQYDDPVWVEKTTFRDSADDIICGLVSSLGSFALFEPKYCKGDLDKDGDGDGKDLAAFTVAFATGDDDGDLNDDGSVNTSDLLLLLNTFGQDDCAAAP
jgi:hypothetical protein